MGPGRTRLLVNVPVGFGDGLNAKETLLATLIEEARHPANKTLAIDATVDNDVRDMQTEGTIFAGHALRDHAKAGLCCSEMRKAWLAAQACRSAGKKDGAPPERCKPTRCFPASEEAAKAADPPKVLELLGSQVCEIDALIVSCVENNEIGRLAALAR
jgi:hypothetical protein